MGLEQKLILQADRELGPMYLSDGVMLEMGGDLSYRVVRGQLSDSLRQVSETSNGTTNKPLLERTFYSILNYIDVLQAGFEINPKKIQDLKIALMGCLNQLAPDLAELIASQNTALNELYMAALFGPQKTLDASGRN